MAILEKEIDIKVTPRNVTYLKSKDYKVIVGDIVNVKIHDLRKTSAVKVTKICDVCGRETPNRSYGAIIRSREAGDGIDRCITCFGLIIGERKTKHLKYENSAESYLINNELEKVLSLYSDKNEKPLSKVSKGSNASLIWNCSKYGDKHEHKVPLAKKIRGMSTSTEGCSYCSKRIINETNCLATTHPHIAEILWNKEDGYKYSFSANVEVDFKCLDCGCKIPEKNLNKVSTKGLSCPNCSDGIPYPEKLMYNILKRLNVKFKMQKTFDWSQSKRYDFYIEEINTIIEVHGDQHYANSFESIGGKTLEEEIENDVLKQRLAIENGINNYIVIDARYPVLSHILKSILDSKMAKMFDLSSVDFKDCDRKSQRSMVKTVCDKWKVMKTVKKTAISLSVSESTVKKYLRRGVELGWCDYNGTEVMKARMRKVVQINDNGEVVGEYESLTSAGLSVETDAGNIYSCCNGTNKSAYGFRWMFKEDYDELIEENIEVGQAKTKPNRVVQMTTDGKTINIFKSAHAASKELGLNRGQANIDKCCKGERLTAYGFKWKYE